MTGWSQVYNRLQYLNQSIESLKESDFPRDRVPLIISHDGSVPEVVRFVEDVKKEFMVIQLFHPFSCFEHPDTFPGEDEKLNEGFKGDKYGNPRTGKITCAKHHFTWMLNEVFSLNITTSNGTVDSFVFLEEDYVVAPKIYEAILAGLGVLHAMEDHVPGGLLGLSLDPTLAGNRREPAWVGNAWFTQSFMTGPMSFSRSIFDKIKANAFEYCDFDDYNWDWAGKVKRQLRFTIPSMFVSHSQ